MTDLAWWDEPRPPADARRDVSSVYVKMRDGVRLAVDVFLPPDLAPGTTVPAILLSTRYFRRYRFRPGTEALAAMLPGRPEIRRFTAKGYAYVVVDARGSGASFGYRKGDPSDEEVEDAAEICDWIVAQPWSNGTIGGTGISYEGTTAEFLLRNRHPAVKAVAIRFAVWDAYADIMFPGGVRTSWFYTRWSDMNKGKDENRDGSRVEQQGGWRTMLASLQDGVARVDEDLDGSLLTQAIKEHEDNYDLTDATRFIEFRDDEVPLVDRSAFSNDPCYFVQDATRDSGAIVYSWCGWYDGGFANAAIKRWVALEEHGARLILGPWDHGAGQLTDPTTAVNTPAFDQFGELLRFFDWHLKGEPSGIEDEPPIHYFTVGEGAWKSSAEWPPPGFTDTELWFGPEGTLSRTAPSDDRAADEYHVDFKASTGEGARWQSAVNLRGVRIGWPDRASADRSLLVYETAALERPVEMTGHPVLSLFLAVDALDTAVHCYLEEVRSSGEVLHVTEGQLRALCRKIGEEARDWDNLVPYHTYKRADAERLVPGEVAELQFGLLPISYLFQAGSRIRVALAGADVGNFNRIPYVGGAPTWTVQRNAWYPSRIVLPLRER